MAARFLFLRNEGTPTRWDASRYFAYLERVEEQLPPDLQDLVSERRLMLSSPDSLWHARISSFKADRECIEVAGASVENGTPFQLRYAGVLKVQTTQELYYMPSLVIQELVLLRSGVLRHTMSDLGGNLLTVHAQRLSFVWGRVGGP